MYKVLEKLSALYWSAGTATSKVMQIKINNMINEIEMNYPDDYKGKLIEEQKKIRSRKLFFVKKNEEMDDTLAQENIFFSRSPRFD